jgi:hypothetical protein
LGTNEKVGVGGPGGKGSSHGEDGSPATGHGAGGGGQGATLYQNDGQSRGGNGSSGVIRLTVVH